MRARWIALSWFVATTTAPWCARAQDNKAAAEALFDAARQLMQEKRYAEACPKLADSQRLDPGVGTLLNLGLCYKQNGQTASAWSAYREAASQARSEGQADREQLARNEAAALEPELTRLVIEVPPATAAIEGLTLKRDGAPVPRGLWGVPAPVDPGTRSIDATAPNRKPLHVEAKTTGAGATARVVIPPLEALAPAAAAAPAVEARPSTADAAPPDAGLASSAHPGRTQRIIGYAIGGAGVVAGAVGTWFCLLSVAQNRAADNTSSATRKQQFHSDADASRTIGFITLGAGAAVLIGGIVVIVTAPSGSKTALTLAPALAEGGGGLALGGSF